MDHTGRDDNDRNYVVINGIDVVGQTSATNASYVEKITFVFFTAPTTSTPRIWLYVMNRTSSTNIFTPNVIYQVPYSFITVNVIGAQTITLPNNALPIRQGQYVGVGFGNNGGSCYRVLNRDIYYVAPTTFSTLPAMNYTSAPGDGSAFSFVVRIIGSVSG